MADVVIDCAKLVRGGVAVKDYKGAALSPDDRYLVQNNGRMGVFIETGTDATRVIVVIPQTLDGQAVRPREIIVPANSLYGLGHWPPGVYNDAEAQVALSFSSVSGVRLFCACVE